MIHCISKNILQQLNSSPSSSLSKSYLINLIYNKKLQPHQQLQCKKYAFKNSTTMTKNITTHIVYNFTKGKKKIINNNNENVVKRTETIEPVTCLNKQLSRSQLLKIAIQKQRKNLQKHQQRSRQVEEEREEGEGQQLQSFSQKVSPQPSPQHMSFDEHQLSFYQQYLFEMKTFITLQISSNNDQFRVNLTQDIQKVTRLFKEYSSFKKYKKYIPLMYCNVVRVCSRIFKKKYVSQWQTQILFGKNFVYLKDLDIERLTITNLYDFIHLFNIIINNTAFTKNQQALQVVRRYLRQIILLSKHKPQVSGFLSQEDSLSEQQYINNKLFSTFCKSLEISQKQNLKEYNELLLAVRGILLKETEINIFRWLKISKFLLHLQNTSSIELELDIFKLMWERFKQQNIIQNLDIYQLPLLYIITMECIEHHRNIIDITMPFLLKIQERLLNNMNKLSMKSISFLYKSPFFYSDLNRQFYTKLKHLTFSNLHSDGQVGYNPLFCLMILSNLDISQIKTINKTYPDWEHRMIKMLQRYLESNSNTKGDKSTSQSTFIYYLEFFVQIVKKQLLSYDTARKMNKILLKIHQKLVAPMRKTTVLTQINSQSLLQWKSIFSDVFDFEIFFQKSTIYQNFLKQIKENQQIKEKQFISSTSTSTNVSQPQNLNSKKQTKSSSTSSSALIENKKIIQLKLLNINAAINYLCLFDKTQRIQQFILDQFEDINRNSQSFFKVYDLLTEINLPYQIQRNIFKRLFSRYPKSMTSFLSSKNHFSYQKIEIIYETLSKKQEKIQSKLLECLKNKISASRLFRYNPQKTYQHIKIFFKNGKLSQNQYEYILWNLLAQCKYRTDKDQQMQSIISDIFSSLKSIQCKQFENFLLKYAFESFYFIKRQKHRFLTYDNQKQQRDVNICNKITQFYNQQQQTNNCNNSNHKQKFFFIKIRQCIQSLTYNNLRKDQIILQLLDNNDGFVDESMQFSLLVRILLINLKYGDASTPSTTTSKILQKISKLYQNKVIHPDALNGLGVYLSTTIANNKQIILKQNPEYLNLTIRILPELLSTKKIPIDKTYLVQLVSQIFKIYKMNKMNKMNKTKEIAEQQQHISQKELRNLIFRCLSYLKLGDQNKIEYLRELNKNQQLN